MSDSDRLREAQDSLQRMNRAIEAENWSEAVQACRRVLPYLEALAGPESMMTETFRRAERELSEKTRRTRRSVLSSRLADSRPAIFLGFVLVSVLIAGLYGILHNQVSYTVSPEYFTKFKFIQFSLTDVPWPERVRASVVGFLASWWMGIPIGLLVGAGGFLQRDARQMRLTLAWSLVVLVAVTLLIGLAGLLVGWVFTRDPANVNRLTNFVRPGIDNPREFLCAGFMHDASYLGGVLGIPAAWVLHLCWRFGKSGE